MAKPRSQRLSREKRQNARLSTALGVIIHQLEIRWLEEYSPHKPSVGARSCEVVIIHPNSTFLRFGQGVILERFSWNVWPQIFDSPKAIRESWRQLRLVLEAKLGPQGWSREPSERFRSSDRFGLNLSGSFDFSLSVRLPCWMLGQRSGRPAFKTQ